MSEPSWMEKIYDIVWDQYVNEHRMPDFGEPDDRGRYTIDCAKFNDTVSALPYAIRREMEDAYYWASVDADDRGMGIECEWFTSGMKRRLEDVKKHYRWLFANVP